VNDRLIEKLRQRDLDSGGDPATFDERCEAARRDVARALVAGIDNPDGVIQLTPEDLELLDSL